MQERVNTRTGEIFARLDDNGAEMPDPTPVALPLGYKHPPTLEQRIKQMIAVTLSNQAAAAGHESFAEANDFDIDGEEKLDVPDEDDEFAPNDPNLKEAFEREEPVVKERLKKAAKQPKQSPKGGADAEGVDEKDEEDEK